MVWTFFVRLDEISGDLRQWFDILRMFPVVILSRGPMDQYPPPELHPLDELMLCN
jgi:hypothetical protein